jgi:hypothetical protein
MDARSRRGTSLVVGCWSREEGDQGAAGPGVGNGEEMEEEGRTRRRQRRRGAGEEVAGGLGEWWMGSIWEGHGGRCGLRVKPKLVTAPDGLVSVVRVRVPVGSFFTF